MAPDLGYLLGRERKSGARIINGVEEKNQKGSSSMTPQKKCSHRYCM